uniref:Uncharacterized protein n=1 Tax=Strigamia maritima TaxID=126957 RepID=T1J7D1_STRMM
MSLDGSDTAKLAEKSSVQLTQRPTFVPTLEKDEKKVVEYFLENLSNLNRTTDYDTSSDSDSDSEIDEVIHTINLKRCQLRRTEIDDVPKIQKLKKMWSNKLFGKQNIYNLIEKSLLSVTLENRHAKSFLAYAAFYDYPSSIPNLNQNQFDEWLKNYLDPNMTPLNTVFLNYAVTVRSHELLCISELIKAMFRVFVDVKYVGLIDTRQGPEDIKLSDIFSHSYTNFKPLVIRICNREDLVPKLRIRPALVEDNDDLVELFGKQINDLQKHYGEYFLAELIEQQKDELDYCLVAEIKPREIVGFISISKNVDAELLNGQYMLQPFNELRQVWLKPKVHQEEPPSSKPKAKIVITKKPTSEKPTPPPPPVPSEPLPPFSVFTIHLFMMTEEHELRYMELIEAGFKFFPEKEFCAISINCWSSGTPFLSKFTRVTPRSNVTLRQELYVLHRWGLIKNYSVRFARNTDIPSVTKFIHNIDVKTKLINDLTAFCNNLPNEDGKALQVFILECFSQIVGVAIICGEEDIEFLRANYNVEDFIYFGLHRREDHAQVLHFVLNPLFTHLARNFIKEIFRLGNRTCLYHRIYSTSEYDKTGSMSAAAEFLPITDRIKVEIASEKLGLNLASSRTESIKNDFALTFISKKYVFETKTVIRAKVVIVGASNTAFATIKQFIETPFISMLNLYLISPFDLPKERGDDQQKISDIMIPIDPTSALANLRPPFIRMYVRLVKGWMTEIDREKKCIVINNEFELPYNFLVLCCGKQFQIPRAFMPYSNMIKMMTVNNHEDVAVVETRVAEMLERKLFIFGSNSRIIVYGSTFEAVSFVEGLLELGVPAENIVFVESGDLKREHCLQNKIFQNVVSMTLKKCGVQYLPGYIIDMSTVIKKETAYIFQKTPVGVTLISPDNITITVKHCPLLVCFSEKDVRRETFLSINNSSLVYDSGLIIDHEFRTNDPWILAAGPMTLFTRRFRTVSDKRLHQLSSNVIGKHASCWFLLAIQMLHVFAPGVRQFSNTHYTTDAADLLHNFTAPISIHGQLPRKLQYFHICRNGDCVNYTLPGNRAVAREISTGNMLHFHQPFIHFHIGDNGFVESITCISENPINIRLWVKVHGQHNDTLNHLIPKYDSGQIPDLEAYFSEPWCAALLHDRFSEFLYEANHIFGGKVELSKDLIDYFKAFSSGKKSWTREARRNMEEHFRPLGAYTEMEDLLLSYLHYNRNLLPMYILPGTITVRKKGKE